MMTARASLASRWARYAAMVASLLLALLVGAAFAPTLFGRQIMVVTSGSMEPWASVGSVVVTRMTDVTSVGVGDVITFRNEAGTATTHRIVEVVERDGASATYVTRGDANEDADPAPIRVTGRVAKAETVVPHVGRVLAAVRSPIAFLALVLLGLSAAALEKATTLLTVRPGVRPMLT